ncbi:MAG: hypothetical protein ACYCYD_09020 [Acidimicrobiales bacterium]
MAAAQLHARGTSSDGVSLAGGSGSGLCIEGDARAGRSLGVRTEVTDVPAPEAAQLMRMLLGEMWATLGEHLGEDARESETILSTRFGGWDVRERLAGIEQALVALGNRVGRALQSGRDLEVTFVPRLALAEPPKVPGDLDPDLLLRRASQAVEHFARRIEVLSPAQERHPCRSEDGLFTVHGLVLEALCRLRAHVAGIVAAVDNANRRRQWLASRNAHVAPLPA